MKASLKSLVAIAGVWVGSTQLAHAELQVPEPGTLPLVGIAVAAAIYFIRRRK